MKIRYGFVSNSSSSSFLYVGTGFDDVENFVKSINPDILIEVLTEINSENSSDEVITAEDYFEILEYIYEYELVVGGYEVTRVNDDSDEIIIGTCIGSTYNSNAEYISNLTNLTKMFKEVESSFEGIFKEKTEPMLITVGSSC
jgi:hypothetical protein